MVVTRTWATSGPVLGLRRKNGRHSSPASGRFYVNEFGAVFSPVAGEGGVNYAYFGKIRMDPWFPDPTETAIAVTAP
jgi:hypothetical protein